MALVADGAIMQIGCVVEDLAEAERIHSASFGVPIWTRMRDIAFSPERTTYRGEPADFVIHVSLGYAGSQQIELIEPVRGVNLYTEFLERSGPGMHHLGWIPEDYDESLAEARRAGLAVVQQGSTKEMDFVYLEAADMGVQYVELMRPSASLSSRFEAMRLASQAVDLS
ncbi:VOC family protein [Nocardioides sp. Soil796]|uniref:VOC family protein n=1 Tax=Nocardioides sp. Soil796 TaxID=1736412 RepID=UPI00070E8700|nr:VOC family protein [Nocardioides sp. Soil796]KRF10450.1 lactoylglutathione lyase [Nocardioides sp. Soil796]